MTISKEELVEGGSITIYCKRCDGEKEHLIKTKTSEKVRIHCNSCGKNSARLIRRLLKEKSPSEKGRRRSSEDKKAPLFMEEAYYEELSKSNPKPYNQQGVYQIDDVIDHKTFGLGRIVDKKGDNKIIVLFHKIGEKKLICEKVASLT